MSPSTLQALTRANLAILKQKTNLIQLMKSRFGNNEANYLFSQMCPIVNASVGQHIRHSMDHIDLASRLVVEDEMNELHYDLRERGGNDEENIDAALGRIERIRQRLTNKNDGIINRPVQAFFMLSADPTEFHLPSTLSRELGFATHHAIHHMAMVKIIALETLKIPTEDLPSDFGRAPSTVVHDNTIE